MNYDKRLRTNVKLQVLIIVAISSCRHPYKITWSDGKKRLLVNVKLFAKSKDALIENAKLEKMVRLDLVGGTTTLKKSASLRLSNITRLTK
jgi:hypothetical protein